MTKKNNDSKDSKKDKFNENLEIYQDKIMKFMDPSKRIPTRKKPQKGEV